MKLTLRATVVVLAGLLAACATSAKSADVSDSLRKSLDQGGLKDVTVTQDRDKGVVTLAGHVMGEGDKANAESIAKSVAVGQVVANEIVVLPPGVEKDAKKISAALDDGIVSNVKAVFIQHGVSDSVAYTVAAAVVTLTGEVNSQDKRAEVAKLVRSVPNVNQVVNELQVKDQKATSRGGGVD
jgi:osmotically-inducible protein OsmY